jgi:nitroreductase
MEVIMDSLAALLSRRSIRKYDSRAIEDDLIEKLLRAAMCAPSAGNEQPWHFIVIRERALLDAIPTIHPHSGMIGGASAAILVLGDPTLEKYDGYWVQDCSAAVENLLVAATGLGLGAVWLGVYPIEDRVRGLRKLFGVPGHVIPFAVIPIGYPAEHKPPADRYSESRIHLDRW